MTIRIADWEFDHIAYDDESDVLYLNIGPIRPTYGERTPEGHVLLFDQETSDFCGLTIIGAQRIKDATGELIVTIPHPEHVAADELEDVLA